MKKVDTSNIIEFVRQLGATGVTLDHIISAVQETTDSIVRALTGNAGGVIVLYGCINSGSGANYIISSGAIWYNGEIYLVDAFTGTTGGGTTVVLSIVTTYDADDPVKYSNNQNYYTHAIRKIGCSISASGSGISNFSGLTYLGSNILINQDSNIAWISISSFSGGGWADNGELSQRVVIKNGINFLQLKGSITKPTTPSSAERMVTGLPTPSISRRVPVVGLNSGGSAGIGCYIQIDTLGQMFIYFNQQGSITGSAPFYFYFDGVEIPLT